MNLDDLKLFLDVANQLSFARVAEQRQTDPSTVSKAIQRLEAHVGSQLFSRTTRKMKLSEAGICFQNQSRTILDVWDETLDIIQKEQKSLRGKLKFTCSTAMAEMIHSIISAFLKRYKGLEFDWMVTDTQVDFMEHQIDCGIRISPLMSGSLKARKLFDMRYGLFATKNFIENHPITDIHQINELRLFNFSYEVFRQPWSIIWKGKVHEFKPNSSLAVSNASIMKRFIQSGSGIGVMAKVMLSQEINQGEIIEIFRDSVVKIHAQPSAAWLVYRPDSYLPRRTRVFMDYLAAQLRHLAPNSL